MSDNRISNCVSVGSSLKFCLIASGEADIYPRFGPTMEWDTAAGDAVLRAAGGLTTTFEGEPLSYGQRANEGVAGFANPDFVAFGGGTKPVLLRFDACWKDVSDFSSQAFKNDKMLLRLEIWGVISRLNGHGHMVTECSAAW